MVSRAAASLAVIDKLVAELLAVLPWLLFQVINGVLAGLVSVTAACPWISIPSAIVVGAVGGILVVQCIDFLDSQGIDDPVSAISVHLGAGMWGTIATALFAEGPGALYKIGEGPAR